MTHDWRKYEKPGLGVFFRDQAFDDGIAGKKKIKATSTVYVNFRVRVDQIATACQRNYPQVGIYEPHDRTLALCGYGPSIRDFVDELRHSNADIMTTSGAHDVLVANGVFPTYHVECDAQKHKAKLLKRQNDVTQYLIASCCHPDVFDNLEGRNVALWHIAHSPEEDAEVDKYVTRAVKVIGAPSSGGRAMGLAFVLGYRRFIIYGMDSSFPFDESVDEKAQLQHAGEHPNQDWNSKHVFRTDPINGKAYYTTLPLLIAAQCFYAIAEKTQGTFLIRGDSMLAAMVKARDHSRLTAYPDDATLAEWMSNAAHAAMQPRKGPVPDDSEFGRQRAA